MKYARVKAEGEPFYGAAENGLIRKIAGGLFVCHNLTEETYPETEVTFLPPCEPTKIMAVGLNYRAHAAEMGETLPEVPKIFLKPPSALLGHMGTIEIPKHALRVDYECELALVIGKRAKNIAPEEASGYIFGYTCFNDVTARDVQSADGQWTRAKGYDTFAPCGPYIVTGIDPDDLQVETLVNDTVKQSGRTSDFIFPTAKLISFLSEVMTLEPGDIITTGTPSGIGPVKPGDKVEIRIEQIGTLTNFVK